ncbi:hypothetical protein [Epilithonimonas lactis]|uniref:Uncharacterized protein n=1 Tax=Epilithonimonas lactis TaxID=421072 RepID=A0A085BHU8_9FLAO|nr:hypothetical protein [Epilithonimonas lactis]KFC22043.1 hypothetical protein IO89_08760 [Epilithonimonas lactis]SEQ52694.1 hypothetical protein SAMN04488097_2366 [Epilithonimonas lactis]
MIKRIILIAIFYVIIIVTATLAMDSTSDNYLIIILAAGLIFSVLIVRQIYKKYFMNFKPRNQNIVYGNSNINNLNKISTSPFLFGLEKKLLSDDEFYFDNDYFYAINPENKTAKFNLKDITELSRTAININNRTIWQVKIKTENRELIFKFAHNYTIWNKSFLDFYNKIKALNPSAIKSKWSLWRM